MYRLGWVSLQPAPTQLPSISAYAVLKAQLAERGYVEGKNVTFEPRWADGDYKRLPELLAELERIGVDVIFAPGTRNARISQDLVKRTPLVVYTCDAFDHVARLARQGGNVTGVTCMTSELTGKRLELLKGRPDGITRRLSVRARGQPIRPQAGSGRRASARDQADHGRVQVERRSPACAGNCRERASGCVVRLSRPDCAH
jgi:hypothetical protein